MSDTAAFRFTQSSTLFSRLKLSLDRLLLTYAEATIRNGDVPRCESRLLRCETFGPCASLK